MVEKVITDGLVLVKAAATGDIDAEVTAIGTYVDLSEKALTFNPEETGENAQVRPHGPNRRVRVLAGQESGTLALSFVRDSGGTPDPEATFELIWAAGRRFNFVIQEDRTALKALTTPFAVTPAASDANPQYTGSAVITSRTPFTLDGVALFNVTADLDRDYARRV